MPYPDDRKYTKEHEWVKVEAGVATVGISLFAQEELGEIVFVELPEVGSEFKKGDSLTVVESTKAASDVYAPISGKVLEVNSGLESSPELVNSAAHTDGWMVKFTEINESEIAELMNASEYEEFVSKG